MNRKRLFLSIALGFLIMVSDGLVLILVNRIYLPQHPPHWLIGLLFYFDAWPVTIMQYLFPSLRKGPSLLAVATGAVIEVAVLSAIVYALLSWCARRQARA